MIDTRRIPDEILNLVDKLGPCLPVATGEEVRFNCPFCVKNGKLHVDNKWHLYIHAIRDKKFGYWVCHRCSEAGRSVAALAARVGLDVTGCPVPMDIVDAVDSILNPSAAEFMITKDIGLPDGYLPIPVKSDYDFIARDYCLSRGLTLGDIQFYELGYGTGRLRWRIIIPNPSETGYDFWQARWYSPWEESEVKYLSPGGAYASNCLFNYTRVQGAKRIIVCEGPFSAMVAGREAVATFGKHISPRQLQLLLALTPDEFVIAYDGDAVLEGLALATALWGRGRRVRRVSMNPIEDPASVGRQAFTQRVLETKEYNTWSELEVLVQGR